MIPFSFYFKNGIQLIEVFAKKEILKMSQKFSLETKYDLLQPSKRFICTEHIVSLNMKGWKILWTFFCNHLLGKVRKLVLAHLSMSITKNFVLQVSLSLYSLFQLCYN